MVTFRKNQISRIFVLIFNLPLTLSVIMNLHNPACAELPSGTVDSRSASIESKRMSIKEMKADFDCMRHALEEAHPGLYRYSSRVDIDRNFERQRARLIDSTTNAEFQAVLAETLAKIRCGHTNLKIENGLEEAMKNARILPLRMLFEGSRLMVQFNDTPSDRTIRPGMELIEINGHKVSDLISQFLSMAPSDGNIETGKRRGIVRWFAEYYWWTVDRSDNFKVLAKDCSGNIVTARLEGVSESERTTNRNSVNYPVIAGMQKLAEAKLDNLSFRLLMKDSVAIMRVSSFSGDNFHQQVEHNFKTLHDMGTRTLILDLRGNGGGDDMNGVRLASYLTDKPFRYFDRIVVNTITPSFVENTDLRVDGEFISRFHEGSIINPKGGFLLTSKMHPGLAMQSPGMHPFNGKVIVLIDGGTFSTAADFCAVLHHLKRATFVGEETGGGYSGNNSGLMTILTLPNSKVKVRLPMYSYWNAVIEGEGDRRGVRPNHLVESNLTALMSGVDRQLDQAVRLATGSSVSK